MINKKIFIISLIFLSLLSLGLVSAYPSSSPDISIVLLNQDPDPVNQGDTVEIRFKIQNDGAESVENIEIEILPSYPFSLYSGELIRKIGKLRAAQTGADSVIVKYKLKIDEKAVEGDTEIELQILKEGKVWLSYISDDFMIDIDEQDIPDIRVYLRENTILKEKSKGSITLELANVDENDVKFLQLTLIPSDDYKLLSPSNYIYMGDIDADDTESQDFEIYVNKLDDNFVSIPVLLEYQDTNGEKYEKKIDLYFEVYTSRELSKYGLKKRNNKLLIVILIILGIVAYYFYKKKRKKHD